MQFCEIYMNVKSIPHARIETKNIKEQEKMIYFFNDTHDLYFRLKKNLFMPLLPIL